MNGWPDWLQGPDERLFLWLNGGLHGLRSEGVESLMAFANALGIAWVFLPVALAAAFLAHGHARRARLLVELLIAGVLVSLAPGAAKDLFPRARPQRALPEAFGDGRAVAGFKDQLRSRSFPSGHTATAFCVAAVLCGWARGLPGRGRRVAVRASALVLATLTGLARVYAGAHFPLDVLGGAALGALCAVAALLAVRLVAGARAPPPAAAPRPVTA